MRGIEKDFGSLHQELEEDEVRVEEKAVAYAEAVGCLNNRFLALTLLKAEASALQDRFGAEAPNLLPVERPSSRDACLSAHETVNDVGFLESARRPAKTEKCEHDIRSRRSYREVRDTPAGKIIRAAGPKPWPPLTETQQRVLEAKRREGEATVAGAARLHGEAERELTRSGVL